MNTPTRGWLATALLVALALVAGCSGDAPDAADSASQPTASDRTQADKASTGPAECSEVWRPGRSLPQRYNGCAAGGSTVVPALVACRNGGSLVTYRDRMYAVTGHRVTGIRGDISTDRRYARTYAGCLGRSAGSADTSGRDRPAPTTTTPPPPPPTAAAGPSAYQDGHIWLTTELEGLDLPEVRAVQVQLNAAGYPVVVDGSYGPQTAGAVSDFQAAFGLHVDGIVGPETHAALFGLSH